MTIKKELVSCITLAPLSECSQLTIISIMSIIIIIRIRWYYNDRLLNKLELIKPVKIPGTILILVMVLFCQLYFRVLMNAWVIVYRQLLRYRIKAIIWVKLRRRNTLTSNWRRVWLRKRDRETLKFRVRPRRFSNQQLVHNNNNNKLLLLIDEPARNSSMNK